LRPETDVLDTWFSSALWPFSTMGWPKETKELKRFYPTSVLVTGFDILFFWVARMMMMGLKFMGDVPFRDVYIHGLVRDEKGEKYSKTRGNVVDPLDLIDRFGADALRFTLAALTMPGSDLKLSEARTEGYRHFVNKIWNASRFVLMNLSDLKTPMELPEVRKKEDYSLPDRWIRGRLNHTIREVQKSLEDYKFNEASHTLYQFVWHQFCDWYLELIKPYLYQNEDRRNTTLTQETLLEVLDATLKLLHPFMPFLTEEVWQQLPGEKEAESIMVAHFPYPDGQFDDDQVAVEMGLVIEITTAIRNIRGEMNIPPGEQIKAILRPKFTDVIECLKRNQLFIQNLAKIKELVIGREIERPSYSTFAQVQDAEIFVPMDKCRMEEEAKRLQKEIIKIEREIVFVNKKLSNEQFVSKAPLEVVQQEKEKASEYALLKQKLEENLKKIREVFE
jgi:valyl-tRNA synthetase